MNMFQFALAFILGPLALMAVLVLIGSLAGFLMSKVKNEKLHMFITIIYEATQAAVVKVGATFVEEIKEKSKDGKLTAKEAKEAFNKAKKMVMDSLSPKVIALAKELGIEIEKFVENIIEKTVAELKHLWTKKK